jgi:drug/metabolite transporter (DMT)-like permease
MMNQGTSGSFAMPFLLAQMLVCSFLWANAFLLMKLIGADLSPVALAALRGILGGVLLAVWLLALRQSIVPRGREWRDWALLGFLQGAVPNVLTAYALIHITVGLSSMIQASTPLMVASVAHALFADERLTARRGLGVLVGFSGMAVLLGPAALAGRSESVLGALAMVVTALSYAIGNLYVRTIPDARPLRLAFGQQVFSGLPTLVLVLMVAGPAAFAAAPDHALALAALGLFATALPIVIYMNILRLAGPTLGSMNGYLVPVWTILLGYAFLRETVGLREIAGGVIVLSGVAIASFATVRSRKLAAAAAGGPLP